VTVKRSDTTRDDEWVNAMMSTRPPRGDFSRIVAAFFRALLQLGVSLGVLYALIRFVKWAWQ
jgi:hypothetical protein